MHQRVATLHGTRLEIEAGFAADADLYEVRLDAIWPKVPSEEQATDDLLAITEAAGTKPLLATLRPTRQGGAFDGPEDIRVGLLVAAARAGFGSIDLESDIGSIDQLIGSIRHEAQLWVSDHSQPAAPSRDAGLNQLQGMQDLATARQKVAYPSGSFLDELRALELAFAHAERQGDPAIAPMGATAELRALLAIAGNQATYGHAGQAAFTGQPGIQDIADVWTHWGLAPADLGRRDGWFAVLGDPVSHSLSPRIHNAALKQAGRPERYGALRVPDSIGAVRLLCTIAPRIGLRGASVTMPLKQHVATACEGDAAVAAVGAANCIRWDEVPVTTNTDASALAHLLDGSQHVAVIGAGGAARAAIYGAHANGATVTLIARPGARTDATAAHFGVPVAWENREDVLADTWVQATPLGMHGEPSPVAALRGAERAIELVYGADKTDFEQRAEAAGARVTNGREFLVEQAVQAYQFWTGRAPDRVAMERAL